MGLGQLATPNLGASAERAVAIVAGQAARYLVRKPSGDGLHQLCIPSRRVSRAGARDPHWPSGLVPVWTKYKEQRERAIRRVGMGARGRERGMTEFQAIVAGQARVRDRALNCFPLFSDHGSCAMAHTSG